MTGFLVYLHDKESTDLLVSINKERNGVVSERDIHDLISKSSQSQYANSLMNFLIFVVACILIVELKMEQKIFGKFFWIAILIICFTLKYMENLNDVDKRMVSSRVVYNNELLYLAIDKYTLKDKELNEAMNMYSVNKYLDDIDPKDMQAFFESYKL